MVMADRPAVRRCTSIRWLLRFVPRSSPTAPRVSSRRTFGREASIGGRTRRVRESARPLRGRKWWGSSLVASAVGLGGLRAGACARRDGIRFGRAALRGVRPAIDAFCFPVDHVAEPIPDVAAHPCVTWARSFRGPLRERLDRKTVAVGEFLATEPMLIDVVAHGVSILPACDQRGIT